QRDGRRLELVGVLHRAIDGQVLDRRVRATPAGEAEDDEAWDDEAEDARALDVHDASYHQNVAVKEKTCRSGFAAGSTTGGYPVLGCTLLPYEKYEYCRANSSRLLQPVWNRRRDDEIEIACLVSL